MTYLLPASFRPESLDEACRQLDLTDDEAPDTQLTNAIARMSQRVDNLTNDHFESETLTLELDGTGETRLLLPKRCTAVTTVKLRGFDGTLGSAQTSTLYRLHSSLLTGGLKRARPDDELDYLDTVPYSGGLALSSGWVYPYNWPWGSQTVQVAGTFSWTAVPADIKRLTALLVYDHFKPIRNDLGRADRFQTAEVSIDMSKTEPTGIPEADDIIEDYERKPFLGLA